MHFMDWNWTSETVYFTVFDVHCIMPINFGLCMTLKVKILRLRSRNILENYFGQQSPTRESELPMLLGCTGSCEPSGSIQMFSLGRAHWQNAGNYNLLSVFWGLIMEISGLLRWFTIVYKEFKFFMHTCVNKSLAWAPKLHASNLDKTMSKLL